MQSVLLDPHGRTSPRPCAPSLGNAAPTYLYLSVIVMITITKTRRRMITIQRTVTIPTRITIIVIVIVIIDNMVKPVKYYCVTKGQGKGEGGI